METKTLDEIKDKYYGKIGSPERNRIEKELENLRTRTKKTKMMEKEAFLFHSKCSAAKNFSKDL